ncbi:hypothetical protein BDV59DRAFT_168413 [Aspergillus ambiguus]|uniref:uncharacterized protein n=1 Tax=Aspergillus ambiguus TaxID=176160 RepID=UPI003CCE1F26
MALLSLNKSLSTQYIQITSHHVLQSYLLPCAMKMPPTRRPRKLSRRNLRLHAQRPENASVQLLYSYQTHTQNCH